MQPPVLPLSNPSPMPTVSAATAATTLLRSQSDLSPNRLPISPQSEDDDNVIEAKPLLPRASSYTNLTQKRRRRASPASGGQSFREGVEHAASETYLVTRLGFNLLRYLGWVLLFLLKSGRQRYNLWESTKKQVMAWQLDIYFPKNTNGPKPVVAFVTGGAWIIGYKAWGSLLGQQLSERDIIVACIDYRNFPQGTMSDMVKDASEGISFVCNHIAEYGGDPNRIYLMGQSAGAHIAACALLEQAIKEAGEGESTSWSLSRIRAYFGLSGGYNLFNLIDHFDHRGLYRSIFLSIMEGEQSLRRFSPEVVVQDPSIRNAVSLLPPTILFHGTADCSIPSDASKDFADTLQRVGGKAESILYEGRSHTDIFLQDPMRGGDDKLFEDLVSHIHAGDSEALAKDANAPPRKRLVPEFMLKLARRVSPF
ncbi:hypothetical protein RHSIM_Rhsim09G0114700 [Rhododendron simsii]|uniref:protein-S-isoprenylcysteine alpha-carbonyl methylesterase n=1 Tax=Rhododendron simsii TaxID=118357 RepID=A0A834LDG1_RHOSS|nr:hypothetical protein RHSIM_Rhsim09G0114700 [Rhododendron simsii]